MTSGGSPVIARLQNSAKSMKMMHVSICFFDYQMSAIMYSVLQLYDEISMPQIPNAKIHARCCTNDMTYHEVMVHQELNIQHEIPRDTCMKLKNTERVCFSRKLQSTSLGEVSYTRKTTWNMYDIGVDQSKKFL